MSSSVGMMTFPIYGKIKNVPKHQPGVYIIYTLYTIHITMQYMKCILSNRREAEREKKEKERKKDRERERERSLKNALFQLLKKK